MNICDNTKLFLTLEVPPDKEPLKVTVDFLDSKRAGYFQADSKYSLAINHCCYELISTDEFSNVIMN